MTSTATDATDATDDPGPSAAADRGRWFAPLHAVAAGAPVGLFAGSVGFDIASRAADKAFIFPRGAFWLLAMGILAGVVVGVPGVLAFRRFDPAGARAALGRKHVVLTDLGIVVGIASFVARLGSEYGRPVAVGPVALDVVAFALILAGAWIGAVARVRYQPT